MAYKLCTYYIVFPIAHNFVVCTVQKIHLF